MPRNFEPDTPDFLDFLSKQSFQGKQEADYLSKQPVVGPWIPPEFENNFDVPPPPYKKMEYRKHTKSDTFEVRGMVDVTNAVADTVAFNVIPVYRKDHNFTVISDVYNSGEIEAARYEFEYDTGDVIISWPIGGGDPGVWQIPTLINGWANAGDPYDDIAYRAGLSGLEFKGHITGGDNGTIAFYLDAAYWPTKDLTTITDIADDAGLGSARIYIYRDDGGVEITRIN